MTALLQRVRAPDAPRVTFTWNGQPLIAHEGDTILTALLLATDHVRRTIGDNRPRAGFCLMGACQDCWVQTEQGQRLRACSTPVESGMALVNALPGELPCR
ncbi:(2Fe-2S)-binding protein [Bordetella sp. 15P40C-2]|uniref:(2Fe-2S)-binding protein n=1 Tax=Bordetella sp. 15P40C-2 TaxID=2572246 RepID=UPI00132A6BC7|nr:(2Fe-2S)-binding protein [Bordetella sp. 15P40C-2]MVW70754.1 (2Fe-2S)-binding protein [Bordetella sp. 15P40C-2]